VGIKGHAMQKGEGNVARGGWAARGAVVCDRATPKDGVMCFLQLVFKHNFFCLLLWRAKSCLSLAGATRESNVEVPWHALFPRGVAHAGSYCQDKSCLLLLDRRWCGIDGS
jgi:hypothetical protein